jgi:branched-chain amino acid transport system substrate-binding protein
MGGDGLYDTGLIQLATPETAEGCLVTFFGGDMEELPAAKEFVKAYKAKYGPLGPFSTYAYDAANIVIEAIKRAGKKDRAAVLAEVKKTKDFHGAIGVTNFDDRGDTLNKMIGIFQASGDRFKYIGPAEP